MLSKVLHVGTQRPGGPKWRQELVVRRMRVRSVTHLGRLCDAARQEGGGEWALIARTAGQCQPRLAGSHPGLEGAAPSAPVERRTRNQWAPTERRPRALSLGPQTGHHRRVRAHPQVAPDLVVALAEHAAGGVDLADQ